MVLRLFISLLYLSLTSHLHISMHFCCDEMVSWSICSKAKNCGGDNCSKKSCCQDKEISIQDSGDHSTPEYIQVFSFSDFVFYSPVAVVLNGGQAKTDATFHVSHAPPNLSLRKIYLLCEVFRL
jgi:hypothetical protein